jgi:hypothetical protein
MSLDQVTNFDDSELRGFVLHALYEKRRNGKVPINGKSLNLLLIPDSELLRVSAQLKESGYLEGHFIRDTTGSGREYEAGMGKLTRDGIDVVEKKSQPNIGITFVSNTTIISNSQNVTIGNNNQVQITNNLEQIVSAIKSLGGSDADKKGAIDLLKKFAEHPLVAAAVGSALGGLFS